MTQSTVESLVFPDAYMRALTGANRLFPLLFMAQIAAGGLVIVDAAVEDPAAWEAFKNGHASIAQIDTLGGIADVVHPGYDVLHRYRADNPPPFPGSRPSVESLTFSRDDIVDEILDPTQRAIVAIADLFARCIIPLNPQHGPADGQRLFSGAYPREAKTLAALWRAANRSLHSAEGRVISDERHDELRGLRERPKPNTPTVGKLQSLLKQAVLAGQPEAEAVLGSPVPELAIARLATAMTFGDERRLAEFIRDTQA